MIIGNFYQSIVLPFQRHRKRNIVASIEALAARKSHALISLDEAITRLHETGLDVSGRPPLKRATRDGLGQRWNLCLVLEHSGAVLSRCYLALAEKENELVGLRSEVARLQAENMRLKAEKTK